MSDSVGDVFLSKWVTPIGVAVVIGLSAWLLGQTQAIASKQSVLVSSVGGMSMKVYKTADKVAGMAEQLAAMEGNRWTAADQMAFTRNLNGQLKDIDQRIADLAQGMASSGKDFMGEIRRLEQDLAHVKQRSILPGAREAIEALNNRLSRLEARAEMRGGQGS